MNKVVKGLFLLALTQITSALFATELVVYSARKEHLIKPVFDAYTQQTGTKIKYITDKAGALVERLKAEGSNTPADLLITVDAGNLWQAKHVGLLQAVDSAVLDKTVPAHLRDPDNHWFGLSIRARTIVYNSNKLKASELSTYEDLANAKWKGRLCLRTSKKVYNQSLVATLIARLGEEQAEKIVKGWVNNLAVAPFSNDTKALQAVVAGVCDATIVNTYYFGRLMKKENKLPLKIFWPNQQTSGVHVNVSGAGVLKHSKNKAEAQKLLAFFVNAKAQKIFSNMNMEYPIDPALSADEMVKSWGEFKQDQLNVSQAGQLQAKAIMLMDRVGYK